MCSPKSLLAIFLLCLFLPTVTAFWGMENKIQEKELPEYSEYLRQQNQESTTLATTVDTEIQLSLTENFPPLPSIRICKQLPKDGDLYGTVYCWTMFCLYFLIMILVVLHIALYILDNLVAKTQKRLDSHLEKLQKSNTQIENLKNDYQLVELDELDTNNKGSDGKSTSQKNISGMFPV